MRGWSWFRKRPGSAGRYAGGASRPDKPAGAGGAAMRHGGASCWFSRRLDRARKLIPCECRWCGSLLPQWAPYHARFCDALMPEGLLPVKLTAFSWGVAGASISFGLRDGRRYAARAVRALRVRGRAGAAVRLRSTAAQPAQIVETPGNRRPWWLAAESVIVSSRGYIHWLTFGSVPGPRVGPGFCARVRPIRVKGAALASKRDACTWGFGSHFRCSVVALDA